jgi:hypothetical protein
MRIVGNHLNFLIGGITLHFSSERLVDCSDDICRICQFSFKVLGKYPTRRAEGLSKLNAPGRPVVVKNRWILKVLLLANPAILIQFFVPKLGMITSCPWDLRVPATIFSRVVLSG